MKLNIHQRHALNVLGKGTAKLIKMESCENDCTSDTVLNCGSVGRRLSKLWMCRPKLDQREDNLLDHLQMFSLNPTLISASK